MAALNPFRTPDQHIMDDADLAGPLIFCFCFAMFLLFVSTFPSHAHFSCMGGESHEMVACNLGWETAIRLHLRCGLARGPRHLLSPQPHVPIRYRRIPSGQCPRILSVTSRPDEYGECRCQHGVSVPPPLLPVPAASADTAFHEPSGLAGYVLSALSIIWCTYSASGIFVSVLRMSEQRLLVAYPVGLFYASFALLSVFDALR